MFNSLISFIISFCAIKSKVTKKTEPQDYCKYLSNYSAKHISTTEIWARTWRLPEPANKKYTCSGIWLNLSYFRWHRDSKMSVADISLEFRANRKRILYRKRHHASAKMNFFFRILYSAFNLMEVVPKPLLIFNEELLQT